MSRTYQESSPGHHKKVLDAVNVEDEHVLEAENLLLDCARQLTNPYLQGRLWKMERTWEILLVVNAYNHSHGVIVQCNADASDPQQLKYAVGVLAYLTSRKEPLPPYNISTSIELAGMGYKTGSETPPPPFYLTYVVGSYGFPNVSHMLRSLNAQLLEAFYGLLCLDEVTDEVLGSIRNGEIEAQLKLFQILLDALALRRAYKINHSDKCRITILIAGLNFLEKPAVVDQWNKVHAVLLDYIQMINSGSGDTRRSEVAQKGLVLKYVLIHTTRTAQTTSNAHEAAIFI